MTLAISELTALDSAPEGGRVTKPRIEHLFDPANASAHHSLGHVEPGADGDSFSQTSRRAEPGPQVGIDPGPDHRFGSASGGFTLAGEERTGEAAPPEILVQEPQQKG